MATPDGGHGHILNELEELRKEICSGSLLRRAGDGQSLALEKAPRHVRILMVGPIGVGKSAFINSVDKALYAASVMPSYTQDPSAEGTYFLDEYISNDRSCFSFLDMRGQFEWFDEDEQRELQNIVSGQIGPGKCLLRNTEKRSLSGEVMETLKPSSLLGGQGLDEQPFSRKPEEIPVEERVHGMIIAFSKFETVMRSADNERFLELMEELEPLRQFIRDQDIEPICIITHMDNARYTHARALETRQQATQLLRLKPENVFFVTNYDSKTFFQPSKPEQDLDVLRPVRSAIETAAARVRRLTEHEQQSMDARVDTPEFPTAMREEGKTCGDNVPIASLFRVLQPKYNWKPEQVRQVLSNLEEQDIVTAQLLREYWEKEPFKRAAVPPGYHAPLRQLLGIS